MVNDSTVNVSVSGVSVFYMIYLGRIAVRGEGGLEGTRGDGCSPRSPPASPDAGPTGRPA